MDGKIRKLPDSELEIMQAVWACREPVVRTDIEEYLRDRYPIAQTTLLTLLTRLTEKGFLEVKQAGRVRQYFPLVSRQSYLAQQGNRFFHKLCGGSISAFANALCDSGLTKEELAELRRLLEREEL